MTLDKLKTGECGRIISVRGEGELRHHLLDMGLTPGTEVSLRKTAPMGDPYLTQTDGAYSAACGRRVPSRQKSQALSMTSGLLRRTGSRPCSRPAGSLSVLVFWECEVWWFAGRG